MRAWRRRATATMVCLALLLVAVPAAGAPDAMAPRSTPWAELWEAVSDLWNGISTLWAGATGENATVPAAETSSPQWGLCVSGCNQQGDEIDPNG